MENLYNEEEIDLKEIWEFIDKIRAYWKYNSEYHFVMIENCWFPNEYKGKNQFLHMMNELCEIKKILIQIDKVNIKHGNCINKPNEEMLKKDKELLTKYYFYLKSLQEKFIINSYLLVVESDPDETLSPNKYRENLKLAEQLVYTEGITYKGIMKLRQLKKELEYDNRIEDFKYIEGENYNGDYIVTDNEYESFLDEVYHSGFLNKYNIDNLDYIRHNCNLDLLLLALDEAKGKKHTSKTFSLYKCFFHSEQTPSFAYYYKKNLFYCYGCGVGGGLFDFVREFYKGDYFFNEFKMNFTPNNFTRTVDFVCALYKLKVTNNAFEKSPEVKRLQEIIKSDEFYEKVYSLYEVRHNKSELNIPFNTEDYNIFRVMNLIKNNEYDNNFKYRVPAKLYKKSMDHLIEYW